MTKMKLFGSFAALALLIPLTSVQAVTLLGIGSTGLYTINPQTGATTVLNPFAGEGGYVAPTFVVSGTNAYVISGNVLYDYNTPNGALDQASLLSVGIGALAVSNGSLFGIGSTGLYKINPQTGATTLLNPGEGDYVAPTFVVSGTNAYVISGNVLYDYNTPNGALDQASSLSVGIGALAVSAPAETPLPATVPLFATGLGAIGLLGWRRRRKSVADIAG